MVQVTNNATAKLQREREGMQPFMLAFKKALAIMGPGPIPGHASWLESVLTLVETKRSASVGDSVVTWWDTCTIALRTHADVAGFLALLNAELAVHSVTVTEADVDLIFRVAALIDAGLDYDSAVGQAGWPNPPVTDDPVVPPAGGGGGGPVTVTPGESLVFDGTLSSAALNTNTDSTDLTWDDAAESADVTHTDGDAEIAFGVAGWHTVQFNAEVTDSQMNNRLTWALYLDHLTAGSVSIREYTMASSVHIRDDADTYDSGAAAGSFRVFVAAGEKLLIRTKRIDTQTPTANAFLDQVKSYLRIARETYA